MKNMNFLRKLPIPMDIKAQYPITPEMEKIKADRDEEIKKVCRFDSCERWRTMLYNKLFRHKIFTPYTNAVLKYSSKLMPNCCVSAQP